MIGALYVDALDTLAYGVLLGLLAWCFTIGARAPRQRGR